MIRGMQTSLPRRAAQARFVRRLMTSHAAPVLLVVTLTSALIPLACREPVAPNTCRLSGESAGAAVRCAEAFVAAQGYTSAPATVDSVTIAYELLDYGMWRDILRRRRASLGSKAVGVCADSVAVDVAFAGVGDTLLNGSGRAVRVIRASGKERMVHQDFILSALGRLGTCRRLGR